MQLGVVSLWWRFTSYISETQEERGISRSKPQWNVSLRRDVPRSSLCPTSKHRHRLHSRARDDIILVVIRKEVMV